jgi:uncharacterized membrane protein YhaH (DUF805 family)
MNWYLKVLKQYVDFSGRARRTEFWMFVLFNFIFSLAASVLDYVVGTYFVFSSIYSLAILLPSLAVSVRRLHDSGKSGVWFLINFVPVIGSIWFIVLMLKDSQPGANQYGTNPKEEVIAE